MIVEPAPSAGNSAPAAPAEAGRLCCSAACGEVAFGAEAAHEVLVSLVTAEAAEDAGRMPVELVICADCSGSMSGTKIKMMKQTLDFLVGTGLRTADTLGLVRFDHNVTTPL